MSTVQIRPTEGGGYAILLEGHDISHLVAADGVEVSFGNRLFRRLCDEPRWDAYPTVQITLASGLDTDIELPDALVETIVPVEEDEAHA